MCKKEPLRTVFLTTCRSVVRAGDPNRKGAAMSLIPAHQHHPAVEMPRAARYVAILILVVLGALTLAATVDRSGGDPPSLAPQGVRMHLPHRPAALCDVSVQGRFVFIADRPSTAEGPAGCMRTWPSCSRSGRADRVAIGLACLPHARLAAST
jgi:hypothetical protein